MFDDFLNNNMHNRFKSIYDLELNQLDRFAIILFIIGDIIALELLNKSDQAIIQEKTQQMTNRMESVGSFDTADLLVLISWIFFASSVFFLDTSCERLKEEKAGNSQNMSILGKERLLGKELVVNGNIFNVIGFYLSAAGNEIIADSTKKESKCKMK